MIGKLGHKDARPAFFKAGRGSAPRNVTPFKASPGFVRDALKHTVDQPDAAGDRIPDLGVLTSKRRDDHADVDKQRPPNDLTTSDLDKDRPGAQQ